MPKYLRLVKQLTAARKKLEKAVDCGNFFEIARCSARFLKAVGEIEHLNLAYLKKIFSDLDAKLDEFQITHSEVKIIAHSGDRRWIWSTQDIIANLQYDLRGNMMGNPNPFEDQKYECARVILGSD